MLAASFKTAATRAATRSVADETALCGSGFGRSQASLRSDYAPPVDSKKIPAQWYVVGHDPDLEHKLLRELFDHI